MKRYRKLRNGHSPARVGTQLSIVIHTHQFLFSIDHDVVRGPTHNGHDDLEHYDPNLVIFGGRGTRSIFVDLSPCTAWICAYCPDFASSFLAVLVVLFWFVQEITTLGENVSE